MAKSRKFLMGQIIWMSPCGELIDKYKKQDLPIRAVVTSVGRKYFYVMLMDEKDDEVIKFDLATETNVDRENGWWKIWRSKEQYEARERHRRRVYSIDMAVKQHLGKLSDEGIDAIYEILVREGLCNMD